MENEYMNYEETMETEVETEEVETEKSGIGTGKALLIGAGLAAAAVAAVKFGKSMYAKIKVKKELRRPAEGDEVEVTDEDIEEITK